MAEFEYDVRNSEDFMWVKTLENTNQWHWSFHIWIREVGDFFPLLSSFDLIGLVYFHPCNLAKLKTSLEEELSNFYLFLQSFA